MENTAARWPESVLRIELSRQCDAIVELADSLREVQDFSTETPPQLAITIAKIGAVLRSHCDAAPAEMLRHVHVLLSVLSSHLRFVERARIAQTPWSMLPSLESFLRRFAGPNTNFVIRPQWSYNYSITADLIASYRTMLSSLSFVTAEQVQATFPGGGEIYCVSFPRAEKLNAPLHANFGHELGHIAAARWIKSSFEDFWHAAHKTLSPSIQKTVHEQLDIDPAGNPQDLFKDLRARELIAEAERICRKLCLEGLRELIADAIAVHVFGTTALVSQSEMAARAVFDGSPLAYYYYPPWCYRLRLMMEACQSDLKALSTEDARPWVQGLALWRDQLQETLSADNDQAVFDLDAKTQLAYQAIGAAWNQIRNDAVSAFVKEQPRYSILDRAPVIDKLVQRITDGVIPDDEGTWTEPSPAPLEDILAAAWAFKLSTRAGAIECEHAANNDVLGRLVLKAIESSHVQEIYGPILRDETA